MRFLTILISIFLTMPIAAQHPLSSAGVGSRAALTSTPHTETRDGDLSRDEIPSTPVVRTDIVVRAGSDPVENQGATAYQVSAQDILSSAGTYGDFSRYLQLFPGVTFNNDESDDVLVRGGNPIENLYQIDGFDIPNINHIATQGTTGGLVSMIDTSAIQNLDFLTGGYDASYDERLSSVIGIHTRELQDGARYAQLDAGFVGAGGTVDLPVSNNGALLLSAHRSLLNLFTDDIGLNGVPIYTNYLLRANGSSPTDSMTFLAVGGVDSIKITPACLDGYETNTINTQYSGWRVTVGLRWQHQYSTELLGTLSLSHSEDRNNIQQQDQMLNGYLPINVNLLTFPAVPVYSEQTHDGVTNVRYDWHGNASKAIISGGLDLRLNRVAYDVAQPIGEQSPLSIDPQRSDATSFTPNSAFGSMGYYIQLSAHLTHRWTMGSGFRYQTFDFGGHQTITPRWNMSYDVSPQIAAHLSFGEYAQLPPYIDMTSFPQNKTLSPMRDRQLVAGIDARLGSLVSLKLESYRKDYQDYPVSTEYPTLSLANQVDTLGQEFIWMPLTSEGRGRASGIELSAEAHYHARLYFMGNIALARTKYSGLDGILRPGNFDYPIVVNAAGVYRSKKRYEVSYRYEYSSGRPYTPFDLTATFAQNRPIYDLTQVNGLRGPYYSRLDFSLTRNFSIHDNVLSIYAGLENAFDRQNFLGYALRPRVNLVEHCTATSTDCIEEVTQMGRFPNIGARFHF